MNKNIIVLNALEAQDIVVLNGGQPFKYSDKKPDGTENKLAGQNYWRLRYNGTVFTSNDARFVAALDAGDVASVKLATKQEDVVDDNGKTVTVTRLEMDSFRTVQQSLKAATFARKMRLLEEQPVSETEMAAFGFAPAAAVAG